MLNVPHDSVHGRNKGEWWESVSLMRTKRDTGRFWYACHSSNSSDRSGAINSSVRVSLALVVANIDIKCVLSWFPHIFYSGSGTILVLRTLVISTRCPIANTQREWSASNWVQRNSISCNVLEGDNHIKVRKFSSQTTRRQKRECWISKENKINMPSWIEGRKIRETKLLVLSDSPFTVWMVANNLNLGNDLCTW